MSEKHLMFAVITTLKRTLKQRQGFYQNFTNLLFQSYNISAITCKLKRSQMLILDRKTKRQNKILMVALRSSLNSNCTCISFLDFFFLNCFTFFNTENVIGLPFYTSKLTLQNILLRYNYLQSIIFF